VFSLVVQRLNRSETWNLSKLRTNPDGSFISAAWYCLDREHGAKLAVDAEKTRSTSMSKRQSIKAHAKEVCAMNRQIIHAPSYVSTCPGDPWSISALPRGIAVRRDERNGVTTQSTLTEFVRIKFIPEYVEQKSIAGRRHYQAMLKHILRPDTVDQVFNPGLAKSRLKAIPNWPYLDKIRVCELREQHVRDLIVAAVGQGYSSQTVKHIRSVLGVIIAHAKREGLFTNENPVTSVESPQIRRHRLQDLTIGQARTMLRMMQHPEREIALIAITTGMSIQEICGLQWKHINLERISKDCEGDDVPPGCILLKQHWYPDGIVDLHTNRIRLIEIPQPLAMTFLRLKQEANSSEPTSFVFAFPSGAPIRPASLCTMRLKLIGRQIAVPWLSWQVVKRAHDAILSELRIQLSNDLVSSTW